MDVSCSPQTLSCQVKHLQIPFIFLLALRVLPVVTETKEPIRISGENGGEVVFHCPYNDHMGFISYYLQKEDVFVNGYHASLPIPQTWENTRLDSDHNVHMNQLTISHAGKYTCHMQYTHTSMERDIELSVTATYTKPSVTMSCRDQNCKVTCTSRGGYPKNQILWDVHALGNASSQICDFTQSPPECDAKTQLCNISSTASFNCSSGLNTNLSCYVDDTEIFSTFSICESQPPAATPDSPPVTLAVCVVMSLVVIGGLGLLLWKVKKARKERTRTPTVEEGLPLKE